MYTYDKGAELRERILAAAVSLNSKALSHARSLIMSDKISGLSGSWSFSWSGEKSWLDGNYDKWCLGHTAGADPKVASGWSFPISDDGSTINYQGVVAAKKRAAQFGHKDIENAADSLITAIKNKKGMK